LHKINKIYIKKKTVLELVRENINFKNYIISLKIQKDLKDTYRRDT